jgi:3-oxoacyl-[acyl-carrier protein] reductase
MERKVALVTGSSRGIGRGIVLEFAKYGYDVVINYNTSKDSAFSLKEEVEKLGVKVLVVKCDVSLEEDVVKMVNLVMSEFGHIDVLVNNAAIEECSNFYNKSKSSFERILGTNLIGTFLVSKEVSKYMLERKVGHIINVSSNNSINKYDPSTLEYDCSKAGINILTKNMAKEFAPYINVNAVAPGWVLTEKNEELDKELNGCFVSSESENILLKRFVSVEEIAKVVLFLAGDDSSYINGEVIVVDGGC